MADGIAVLNAGSSSLKFALFEGRDGAADPALVLRGQIEGIGRRPRFVAEDAGGAALRVPEAAVADHEDALALLLDWLATEGPPLALAVAGHRVVHGGPVRSAPERITAALIDELASYNPLAPHHQPHNVTAIRALARRLPDLPQVACFDTAFHAGQPDVARRFGLPFALEQRGLKRYGFHGLSYEYIVTTLPGVLGGPVPERVVIAHLGNGASLAAVKAGRGIATTMGFSTLDGLVMGTRCGALDPGVLLYLMREDGLGYGELSDLLYNRSGLRGLSGISGDMRALLASDEPRAAAAVELFCYRIRHEIGALAAALEGLDALVFTGGIGEHAAPVRRTVCEGLGWLGLDLDAAANGAGGPRLTSAGSRVSAWVVPTNEELVIARHSARLLAER